MASVSIIVPAFNASRYIGHTLRSVLQQDYKNTEVIVVDDGSTDDTEHAVREFGSKVRYLRKANGGQGSARNAGMAIGRGEFFAFLDADDLWLPTKLRTQMELFDLHPDLGLVYSDAVGFDQDTGKELWCFSQRARFQWGDVLRPLVLCDFIPTLTVVIRREVWEQVGGFNETDKLRCLEDWEMWLRIASRYRMGFVKAPLAKYRIHRLSSSRRLDPDSSYESRLSIVEEALARDPSKLKDLRRKAISNVQLDSGKSILHSRASAEARPMLLQALRTAPFDSWAMAYLLLSLLPVRVLRWVESLRRCLRAAVLRRIVRTART